MYAGGNYQQTVTKDNNNFVYTHLAGVSQIIVIACHPEISSWIHYPLKASNAFKITRSSLSLTQELHKSSFNRQPIRSAFYFPIFCGLFTISG